MPGLYTHTSRIGSVSEAEYNADHQNHINNHIPEKIDDYSPDVAGMRATTDPGEIGTESLPTTLAGEIERIRKVIVEITGETYWYETPATNLASVSVSFAIGTRMLFQQTAAPSGWTKDTSFTDNSAVRLTTGSVSSRTSGKSFTTCFANNYTSDGTTLTSAQAGVGSHTHSYGTFVAINSGTSGGGSAQLPTTGTTGSASSAASSSHTHTVDLDVNYYDCIIASKT